MGRNGLSVHAERNTGVHGTIDGPQPNAAQLAALLEGHAAAAKAQDERFAVRVEAIGGVNCVKFTAVNKHIIDPNPPAIYVSFPVLLKLAGQLLAGMDVGGVSGEQRE
jgi:hypothetical protein